MVDVVLWASLRPLADGRESVSVEADTVGGVLQALKTAYPRLSSQIDSGISVAVDGRIIAGSLFEPVAPDSEVVLLQQMKGG